MIKRFFLVLLGLYINNSILVTILTDQFHASLGRPRDDKGMGMFTAVALMLEAPILAFLGATLYVMLKAIAAKRSRHSSMQHEG